MDYSNTTFLEYQKKKREMLDGLGRISGMCNGVNCGECPFNKSTNNTCGSFEMLYPEEALNVVMSYEPKVDWTKVPVDTKILVRDYKCGTWVKRYFAKYINGEVYAYDNGTTSFSAKGTSLWTYAKLYKDNEK